MSDRIYPKAGRPERDLSHRRWHVRYEDMIGEGAHIAPWIGYHHTRIGARITAWWNQNVRTYGGIVTIRDTRVVGQKGETAMSAETTRQTAEREAERFKRGLRAICNGVEFDPADLKRDAFIRGYLEGAAAAGVVGQEGEKR